MNLAEKVVEPHAVEFPDDGHKKMQDALFGTIRCAMEAILDEENGSTALQSYSSSLKSY